MRGETRSILYSIKKALFTRHIFSDGIYEEMAARFTAPQKIVKISDRIISQIRDMILSGDLKPGDRVGSEKELIVQFGVSKGTLREALRVLEALGLVEIRKGLSGGVFIAEVDMKTTIHSIINFLHFKSVSIKDITMLRYYLEPFISQLVLPIITDNDIQKLQAIIESGEGEAQPEVSRGISFHRYLARMTHNPVLILIMDFVDNLLTDIKLQLDLGPEFHERVKKSHREILDCLTRKDGPGAKEATISDILWVGYFIAKMLHTPHFDPVMAEGSSSIAFQNLADREGEKAIDKPAVSGTPPQDMLLERVGSGELYVLVRRYSNQKERSE